MKTQIIIVLIFFLSIGVASAQKQTSEQYIAKYKLIAIQEMLDYKIPASITLAQGILESGNGNSRLATKANNHFGIKCHSDWKGKKVYHDDDEKHECFRKYPFVEDSYRDHSLFLSRKKRYADLFDLKLTNYKGWAKGLKKAGYATNPKYPKRLIDIIERYGLDKYDTIEEDEFEKIIAMALSDPDNKSIIPEKYQKGHKPPPPPIVKNKKPVSPSYHEIKYLNRIKYVIVKKGDTPERICNEFDVWLKQFYKFNDLKPGVKLKVGTIIYLQPKRRKGDVKYHTITSDETLWDASQKHGIKMKWLLKRNHLKDDSYVPSGVKLWLRKTKPASKASF
ncbi:MAG: glucosaminidase domain-containing protein [Bacteroidales bacterium]|nr:glucosaminidase domain-containing protein [Bacteroidales bacterium]